MNNEEMLDTLSGKLDKQSGSLQKIAVSVAKIEAVCPTCQGRIGHIETVVKGNGAGLCSRTARLEESKSVSLTNLAAIVAVAGCIGALIGLVL